MIFLVGASVRPSWIWWMKYMWCDCQLRKVAVCMMLLSIDSREGTGQTRRGKAPKYHTAVGYWPFVCVYNVGTMRSCLRDGVKAPERPDMCQCQQLDGSSSHATGRQSWLAHSCDKLGANCAYTVHVMQWGSHCQVFILYHLSCPMYSSALRNDLLGNHRSIEGRQKWQVMEKPGPKGLTGYGFIMVRRHLEALGKWCKLPRGPKLIFVFLIPHKTCSATIFRP